MTIKFNKQQQQAIEHFKGACAVIAGAGSGKSTVLLNRIDNLINTYKINENNILAISFTRNTADELKSKLNNMGYLNVGVKTFHGACINILQQEGYKINLVKEWDIEKCFKKINEKVDVTEVTSYIGYQKNYLKSYTDEFVYKQSDYTEDELRQYFKSYELMKKQTGTWDFEDYLIKCYEVLKSNPGKYTYEFVLVDEHQDSNLVQNLLIKELCPTGNVFCVFDYRQAIYSFRGGNTEYCMNFEKDWKGSKVINLDMNYRSSKNIVDKANDFIRRYYGDYKHYADSVANSKYTGEIEVNTYYKRDEEGKEVVDKIESMLSKGESPNEIAVLYRLNSHASYIESELKKRDIEYDIADKSSFFKRKEIEGIMSYLRLINNAHDDSAFENIFNLRNEPLTFFSKKDLSEVRTFSGKHNLSMYESFITMKHEGWKSGKVKSFEDAISKLKLQKDKGVNVVTMIDNVVKSFQLHNFIKDKYTNEEEIQDRINSIEVLKSFVKGDNLEKFITFVYSGNTKKKNKKDCVKLMSIHASKGLEFKNVFLVGVEDGKFPHDNSDLLDEARLYYVGVTRSKENLYLSQIYDGNRFVFGAGRSG